MTVPVTSVTSNAAPSLGAHHTLLGLLQLGCSHCSSGGGSTCSVRHAAAAAAAALPGQLQALSTQQGHQALAHAVPEHSRQGTLQKTQRALQAFSVVVSRCCLLYLATTVGGQRRLDRNLPGGPTHGAAPEGRGSRKVLVIHTWRAAGAG